MIIKCNSEVLATKKKPFSYRASQFLRKYLALEIFHAPQTLGKIVLLFSKRLVRLYGHMFNKINLNSTSNYMVTRALVNCVT